MQDIFTGGFLGQMLTALSFASALVATLSFFLSESYEGEEKKKWVQIAKGSLWTHIISVFGIILTLFGLIYTHNYAYHYVWSHSSNELPVYYMISCFWEGQEGSFLLWCFWHSVLAAILLFSKNEFRNLVLAIISSIEMILSSMILGAYANEHWVMGIYILMAAFPLVYFSLTFAKNRRDLAFDGNFHLASICLAALGLLLMGRGQMAFANAWGIQDTFTSIDGLAFSLFVTALLGYIFFYTAYLFQSGKARKFHYGDAIAAFFLIAFGVSSLWFETDIWKIGSSPFNLLKDVFPENEVYTQDPDFVPSNGSGLNPLLQNYWMVIHPPTLFLGFASTIVPFAFVMAGLVKRKYTEWIPFALPWTVFSVMILGIGIIMGGYWAYETLNFGGYWNWDPVENGSLVPWLCGIASLHAMLIYQKSKTYLHLTKILIISTFILVLYSTFLTRSGILGDTSVHTFTDLGLSGQLIILLGVYTFAVLVLMVMRWGEIPSREDTSKAWSAEFMLFLGVLVFAFASLEIILSTSLPVINKILGTNVAPPPNLQLFYYKWNVWFAIAFGALSGLGQFLWWKISRKSSISDAIFRPFVIALIVSAATIILLMVNQKEFAYASVFEKYISFAPGDGLITKAFGYLQYGIMALSDELMLAASLFAVFANMDVLISMLRKNSKGLKVMGGTIAHIGFGLMLIGMLFSSGYDEVVSKNFNPEELAGYPEDERMDNIYLPKDLTRRILDYKVTYLGRKPFQGEIQTLQIIERNDIAVKVKIQDENWDDFGIVLPIHFFAQDTSVRNHAQKAGSAVLSPEETRTMELDMEYMKEFLGANIQQLKPKRLNGRMIFRVKFESFSNESDVFTMELEAEESGEEGLLPHPTRRIYWTSDVYVHVTNIPREETREPEFKYHEFTIKMGETFEIGSQQFLLSHVENLTQKPELNNYQIAAAANIITFFNGDTLLANPIYVIDQNNKPGMIEASMAPLHMNFAFVGVDPQQGLLKIQVQERTNPDSDFIVLKAIRKPFINFLWLGTFILTFGFMVSIYRRWKENKARESKVVNKS